MASSATTQEVGFGFWQKMTLGLSAFIIFAFAQFAARGFVDYGRVPGIFHLHGMIMTAWLALLVVQSTLVARGAGALHRRLGWATLALLPVILVVASLTCLTALARGAVPPFFTPGYFLALVHVGLVGFAALVGLAIARRRDSENHRRLILGSTIMLLEPALGRALPMPLIVPWGEWLAMVIQLGVVALIAGHDRRTLGRLHPATGIVALAVVASHVVTEALALMPAWQKLAEGLAAA